MFRKPPYLIWLLSAIVLWLLASFHYDRSGRQSNTPAGFAKLLSEDLQKRISAYEHTIDTPGLSARMFRERLSKSDQQLLLKNQQFYLNAYNGDRLVFWNNNRILINCDSLSDHAINKSTILGKNIFFTFCDTVHKNRRHVISVVIPVAWHFPFENKYLHSGWMASPDIPMSTEISDTARKGFLPVYYAPGKVAYYVNFTLEDIPAKTPDGWTVWFAILAMVCSVVWIQLFAINLIKTRSEAVAMGFLVGITALIRVIFYFRRLPFHFQDTELFSPRLYATNKFLPSLGDLFFNTLLLLWICVFIFQRIDYRKFTFPKIKLWVKWLICLFAGVLLTSYSLFFCSIIESIVVNSRISFDTHDFYNLDIYTLLGFIIVVITTTASILLLHFSICMLKNMVQHNAVIYISLTAIAVTITGAMIWQDKKTEYYSIFLFSYLLFIFFQNTRFLSIKANKLLSAQVLFWTAWTSITATALLQYSNYQKEKNSRVLFASRLVRQKDPMTHYLFNDIVNQLQQDELVKIFLDKPNTESRNALNDHIEINYLEGHLNRYESSLYIYNQDGKALFNADTTPISAFNKRIGNAVSVDENCLFYKENAQDEHYYLGKIPVESTSGILGYVFIDMKLKKTRKEIVYPELLQPGSLLTDKTEDYPYAVYQNGMLVEENGTVPFPLNLDKKKDTITDYKFSNNESYSELWYKGGEHNSIIVLRPRHEINDFITLLSYLFSLQLILTLSISGTGALFNYLSAPDSPLLLLSLTLRRRIHYTMLAIVFFSFLLIGYITINFFKDRFADGNKRRLQNAIENAENAISARLPGSFSAGTAPVTTSSFDADVKKNSFRHFIEDLSKQLGVDINIYNAGGLLLATSQDDIYQKALQARIMRADAYQKFRQNKMSSLVQEERIGSLFFTSSYMPLRNDKGVVLGYLNIPYFASQEEFNSQVSNILASLINIYALVFLLSGVLALFITNYLTSSLNLIISKFKNLNLERNELLTWKYEDDEIGLLVKEYNKMVQKVETQAKLLAQNEREYAWREMARQVAHEIKNPLTPMKLSIQYLQQALAAKKDNVLQLTERVTASLIEQIDNLNYIATEFSGFAKLPEAMPEQIELNELLRKTTEIFDHEDGGSVLFYPAEAAANIIADKSQLIRVFNNLLQNAMQSIPEDKVCKVEAGIRKEGDHAIIYIKDNGTGINEEAQARIFTPYFTTKSSGTGLGLAMTKKIIEFWQGSIWFETEQGTGTTFYVKLPLEE